MADYHNLFKAYERQLHQVESLAARLDSLTPEQLTPGLEKQVEEQIQGLETTEAQLRSAVTLEVTQRSDVLGRVMEYIGKKDYASACALLSEQKKSEKKSPVTSFFQQASKFITYPILGHAHLATRQNVEQAWGKETFDGNHAAQTSVYANIGIYAAGLFAAIAIADYAVYENVKLGITHITQGVPGDIVGFTIMTLGTAAFAASVDTMSRRDAPNQPLGASGWYRALSSPVRAAKALAFAMKKEAKV